MTQTLSPSETATARLPDLTRFVYGTTRLGDDSLPFEDRVAVARAAIDAGLALHTSHTYGDALRVLSTAFDQDRSHVPPFIVKIGWDSVAQVREVIGQNLEPLGLTHLPVGQLCFGGTLAEQYRTGGPENDGLRQLKADGLVGKFVQEIWPWNSDVAVDTLQAGHSPGIIDGYIFYLNPLQRFASEPLWTMLQERGETIVAMRTTCGGSLDRLREHGPDYLKARAAQMTPIYARSGCASWPEFCARFVAGYSNVVSTVGATSRIENLNELIAAVQNAVPLPADIHAEIEELQRGWYEQHDRHAEPWSM
jgi:aryl-alcohol dehydrogenase-like predicted oxidoreductase